MIEQYKRLIYKIIRKHTVYFVHNGAFDEEDLYQAGSIALWEAQQTYNPDGGCSFLTWACMPVKHAILRVLNRTTKVKTVSLDDPIIEDEDLTLLDTIPDPNILPFDEPIIDDETRQETVQEVRAAINRMKSPKQREVIKRVYLEGKERSAAAAEMGMKITALYALDKAGRSTLRRDYHLKQYAMPFFHVSSKRYNSTWTSAVEMAVIWRDEHLAGNRHDPAGV